MRKAIIGLGFFLIAACGGSSNDGDSESGSAAAAGGEDSGSGGSGPSGSAGKGGNAEGGSSTGGAEAGSSQGGSDAGGSPQGGDSARGGSAGDGMGETGGTSGTSGSASGDGGSMITAGRAGSGGGSITDPVCDPPDGDLDNMPYPDCEPTDPDDACELCIEANCCEESKVCYGYDPANVCGWGGPTEGSNAAAGEINCYIRCVRSYVDAYGAYDDGAADVCVPACTTPGCGVIGNATQELVVCLDTNCEDECFVP